MGQVAKKISFKITQIIFFVKHVKAGQKWCRSPSHPHGRGRNDAGPQNPQARLKGGGESTICALLLMPWRRPSPHGDGAS